MEKEERRMNISIFPPEVVESMDEIFQGGKSYMTNKEALKEMQLLRNGAKFNQHDSTVQAFDMAIEALEKQSALPEELKAMKKKAYNFNNSDYANGYISAISTIEGFVVSEVE